MLLLAWWWIGVVSLSLGLWRACWRWFAIALLWRWSSGLLSFHRWCMKTMPG